MPDDLVPAHLQPEMTERGFAHMPELNDSYDRKTVRAYESSQAEGPHVWLSIREEGVADAEAYAHMTAENAWRLADQLRTLVRNHYQGDATPEWVYDA